MELVKILPSLNKFNEYIKSTKAKVTPIGLSGLTDTAKVHLSYATSFYTERPICIITYNEMQAKKLIQDLKYFTEDIVYFQKREIVTYDVYAESKDVLHKRIEALNKIYNNQAKVVVTTIESLMQKTVGKEVLYKNLIDIKVGNIYSLEEVKEKLIYLGYERCDQVEGRGQFSIRGGIVDIAGVDSKHGVRIEFWGDTVDSIRNFDISSQRSTDMVDNTVIYPSNEFVLEKSLDEICNDILKHTDVNEDIELIRTGDYINKIDKYFNSFYSDPRTLLDYLNDNYVIFLDEITKIKNRSENIIKDNVSITKDLIERGRLPVQSIDNQLDYTDFIKKLENHQIVYLEKQDLGFVDTQNMYAKKNEYSFSCREVNFFRSSMDLLFQEVEEANKKGKTVIILGGSPDNCKHISDMLFEKNIIDTTILPGALSAGIEYTDIGLLIITGAELFSETKKKKQKSILFKQGEKIVFADLKIGDYVVHVTHGIGQFTGVNTITTGDKFTKDYIKIKYNGEDALYVPTDALDSVRKYVGAGDRAPKLNRLGSKEWSNTKAKLKSNLREVANELIELYAKRQQLKGFAFSPDMVWQKEFEEKFPYIETDDQLRCIEEMKKDLEDIKPMDRLLCGDVGYGKTEVAIRGAFKACMDQKQVAYLVPTTILANQQYESFKKRMEEYPIKVELLNRFRTKKEQAEVLKKLKVGEVDVLIGTHRILQKDVEFKDLGFLIIDEEHRFGVKDKERIKELKSNVDVLAMTATPIPRTLHMSVVGIRDMSVIYEPPQNRRPVQTYVFEQDEEIVKEAITKELERDGQVFYLYNKVETIVKKANEIASLVPEAKVGFAHGKMTGNELEEIMQEFIDGKINVLVCTTILESGIDIPNANTIIVENADRLGLAQLYQIRGRVGRSDRQGYAYVMYKKDKLLSEVADKRLKAIKEFTEFGSGFKIAMRDLEIRGAGSILGEMQHGHMDTVGYEMYCKILDEVIKEKRGIIEEEQFEIAIDLDVSSYIPDNFIEDSSTKIEVYQEIALCKTEEDIQDVTDEILDRFRKCS